VSSRTGDIELTKLLTLKQYLHVYDEIKRHVSDAAVERQSADDLQRANVLDASVIMMQYVIALLQLLTGVILLTVNTQLTDCYVLGEI